MADRVPPSGSARARLEAFERDQKGKKGFWVKVAIMAVVLVLALVAQIVFKRAGSSEHWRRVPDVIARTFNDEDLDTLTKLLAPGYELEIEGRTSRDVPTQVMRTELSPWTRAGTAHVSRIIDSGKSDRGHWMTFFLTYARGDLSDPAVVPLLRVWFVNAEVVEIDGDWKIARAEFRQTISDD